MGRRISIPATPCGLLLRADLLRHLSSSRSEGTAPQNDSRGVSYGGEQVDKVMPGCQQQKKTVFNGSAGNSNPHAQADAEKLGLTSSAQEQRGPQGQIEQSGAEIQDL